MSGSPVTVTDRIPFTASVSPAQAAAYVRRVLPKWSEKRWAYKGCATQLRFAWGDLYVDLPTDADVVDYARRMVEAIDTLVALGVADKPSDVLRAMAAECIGQPPANI